MSVQDPERIGSDPVSTFGVKHRVALHASLNLIINQQGEACDGDVVVSPSRTVG